MATNINRYLADGPDPAIGSRRIPITPDAPIMRFGSMPHDGGHLLLAPEEKDALLQIAPESEPFIRRLIGSSELIRGHERFCIWVEDGQTPIAGKIPALREIATRVRDVRLESPDPAAVKAAARPLTFKARRQPTTNYLAVPSVSSERRDYVPMAMFPPTVIASNLLLTIADASTYTFGMLHSSVFNVWNKTVSGRLESRTRISAEITYNNFPWPVPSDLQREVIEASVQAVMDTRGNYPDSSLADLYDPLSMPPDLLKAHKTLDKSVLSAYGLPAPATDTEILSELFKRYEALTKVDQLPLPEKKATRKRAAKKT